MADRYKNIVNDIDALAEKSSNVQGEESNASSNLTGRRS